MKCTIILLIVTCLQATAKSDAQNITISGKNLSLEQVFGKIKKQTGYQFFYRNEFLRLAKPVNINVKNASLREALDQCFKEQPLTFKIVGKTVVIKLKEVPESNWADYPLVEFKPPADTIRGRVINEKGEPLTGVSVKGKGGKIGTITDNKGDFEIISADSDVKALIFSYIGYTTKLISIGNKSHVIVTLETSTTGLDEMIVTGYTTQKKREITGAISSVSGKEIENIPLQSFDKAIQGRAAGVLIQTSTGVPGGAVKVRIRGRGSINAGTRPLYIVDGVQMNTTTTTSMTSANPLAYINPNDIASIEILKDAAAASIYGAEAANGVVLITTKKGVQGKTKINLDYYQGVSEPMPFLNTLSTQEYLEMRQEAIKNRYPDRADAVIKSQVLQAAGLSPDLTDAEIAALPTYDWQKAAFRQGNVYNIQLSASGGNEKTTFYLSGAYNNHDGNVVGIDFKRGTFKMNFKHQANKRLSFDMGMNLAMITQNGNTGSWGATTGFAAPQYAAPLMLPTIPIYNKDGSFNAYEGMPGTGFNPVQAATVDDNITRHRSVIGHLSATYKILDGLSFKSFYGIDYRVIRNDYYRDVRTPNGAPWDGYLMVRNRENRNFTSTQTLTYNKNFKNKQKLSLLAGLEYRSDVSLYEYAQGKGFPTYQFRTMQSAANPAAVSGSWSGYRKLGFFGQANYDYHQKYMLSGVLRYDGSSRFGSDNRFGLFPSISAGWDISREDFMKDHKWIDQLKVRIGYGQTGNDQINNVSSRGFYQGGGSYNGKSSLTLQTLANTMLGWEKNVTINIGTDFSFFNRRLYGSVELYNRTSKDLLLNRPIPYVDGFGSVDDNLGEVVNKGIEITLNSDNIRKKDFSWNTTFVISFIKNRVTRLYDTLQSIGNTIHVGYPLDIYYRPKYAGVNSANGRPMWYDANGNITYQLQSADNVLTKDGFLSDYFGGLTNTFNYKGLELSVLFHFDMGRYLYNHMNYTLAITNGNGSRRSTVERYYKNRWTHPGQVTTVPRVIDGGAEINSSSQQSLSTRYLEDDSFIRLREVSLAYQFPSSILDRLNLSSLRIYVTGVNLYTWTAWTGYDPEVVGSNQGVIPPTRSYTAGVQIGF